MYVKYNVFPQRRNPIFDVSWLSLDISELAKEFDRLWVDREHRQIILKRDFVQIVLYLSGLTCTDENVIQKGCPQKAASELGLAFVAPDTSPRGLKLPGEFRWNSEIFWLSR